MSCLWNHHWASMPFCIPTSNKLKFLCLHLPSNWCPQFWDLGHSNRCIVVFYCYNLPFPNNKKIIVNIFSCMSSLLSVYLLWLGLWAIFQLVYLGFIIELCVICIFLVQVLCQGCVLMVCSQVGALSFHSLKWVFQRIEVFNFNTF